MSVRVFEFRGSGLFGYIWKYCCEDFAPDRPDLRTIFPLGLFGSAALDRIQHLAEWQTLGIYRYRSRFFSANGS